MCASTATTRKQDNTSKHERSNPRSIRSVADVFLTLPAVVRKVPTVARSNLNVMRWAELALLLIELVDEKDIKVEKDFDPRSVIDQALSNWVSKHCGDIQVLSRISLGVGFSPDDMPSHTGKEDEAGMWQLGVFQSSDANLFSVKAKVEALEARFPGLGHSAVKVAEAASYHTIAMYSPGFAFDQAQYVYWYGMDNDEDFISERECSGGGEDEDEEEGGEELFKPSDFMKSFPDFFFAATKLSPEQLNEIAASKDDEVAEVARILLDMMQLMEEGASLPTLDGCEVEQAYFSGLMQWDEKDSLVRCYDDFINMANQCSDGYTDMLGLGSVPYDKDEFQKWATQTGKGFELYSKLDRLMQLIGTVANN